MGVAAGVVLWDVGEWSAVADEPLPVKGGELMSVAFSPDGKTLAAGYVGAAADVALWDVAAGAGRRRARSP